MGRNSSRIEARSLQLLVGEAIGEEGMKDAVRFAVPADTGKSQNTVSSIKMYPYTLYFKNWDGQNLEYSFKKEPGVIANLGDRKLILEFTNNNGEVQNRQTVIVEGPGAWENYKEISNSEPYVFIYEEFQGGRKLIASEFLGE